MIKFRLPWALVLACTLCTGCGSAVPVTTTYSWQTQKKMQAARHWEILADDMAGQVKHYLKKREDLSLPVYVVPQEGSAFGKIFRELLVSELMDRDVAVSRNETNALKLEYSTQVLTHGARTYQKFPLKLTVLGTGVAVARKIDNIMNEIDQMKAMTAIGLGVGAGLLSDLALSRYGGEPSQSEVIITTSLSKGDTLLIHQSDIYYINDPDVGHYLNKEKEGPHGKTYNVVN